MVSEELGRDLGQFLSKSVTQGTRNSYAGDWKAWVLFVGRLSKGGQQVDVYLDQVKSGIDRATILALFFKERYEDGGSRARQATSVSAGIRHHFLSALRFESQILTNARAACKMSCDELREHKKESKSKATLPLSDEMIMEARSRLWANKS